MESPSRLFRELKRRRVLRVAGVYAVVAWIVIEVADVVIEPLRLPDWTLTLLILLAALGLPIAIVLAWAFEVGPEGVKRTSAAPADADPGDDGAAADAARAGPGAAAASAPASRIGARFTSARSIGLAIVLLVALAGAWAALQRRGQPEAPVAADVVAVLPFSVQAGPDLAYLREGMVNLLSTKLDGAGELRSVDPHAVIGILRQEGGAADPHAAREIAARVGAGTFILGDVTAAGRDLHLQATLYDAAAEPLVRASAEGSGDALLDLVDELAAQLLAGRSGSRGERVTRVAALTTNSLPALKAYLEGEEHFRRGNFRSALEALREAVAIDTSFALAYYRLSIAAEWSGAATDATAAAEAAAARLRRLSEHDRQLVEAMVAWRNGRGEEAERRYRAIVGAYPDDVEAWFQLAEVLFHSAPLRGGSANASREAFERVLFYDPDHVASLWHLVRIAALEGNAREIDTLTRRVQALAPEGDRTLELVALRAFTVGDVNAQERVLRELGTAMEGTRFMAVWNVAVCGRDLAGADRLVDPLLELSRSATVRAAAHTTRAFFELARGRPASARRQIDAAGSLDPAVGIEYRALLTLMPLMPVSRADRHGAREAVARWRPDESAAPATLLLDVATRMKPQVRAFLLGLLDVRLGAVDRALEHAAALERLPGSAEARRIAGHLARTIRAEAVLARGDTTAALAALEPVYAEVFYPRTMESPFYSLPHARFLRAELLAATGRPREALRWFDSFADYSNLDLAYDAVAHLRRAQIHEQLGAGEPATRHYARFVELWRDAEPELQPLVDAARRRLQALTGETALAPASPGD